MPSSEATRSERSTESLPAKLPSGSRKHIWDTASKALRYAATTSLSVIIEDVPLSPYWDIAPYPFITRYCARLVSW